MILQINWHRPIGLGKFPYGIGGAVVPAVPGIYIFLRSHGSTTEALYVGKASNLQKRIPQQFNNLKLMTAIQAASSGTRSLVYGEFVPKTGQQMQKALPLCEKTLIRYFLAQGHGLVNIQGTKIRFHELHSTRPALKNFIPAKTKIQI